MPWAETSSVCEAWYSHVSGLAMKTLWLINPLAGRLAAETTLHSDFL